MTIFYLQDSRSYTGNCMTWWKVGGGYTSDLSQAEQWTQEAAQMQHNHRETDIPWPKDYIDGLARPTVDHQKVKKDSPEMANSGIFLSPVKPYRSSKTLKCYKCGGFINSIQRYCGECPRCGAENSQ